MPQGFAKGQPRLLDIADKKEFGTKKGSKLFQGLEHSFPLVSSTFGASRMALIVKNSRANAGDKRDVGLISGLATHSSIFAWRIPRTEEPGRLQSVESQRIGHH